MHSPFQPDEFGVGGGGTPQTDLRMDLVTGRDVMLGTQISAHGQGRSLGGSYSVSSMEWNDETG